MLVYGLAIGVIATLIVAIIAVLDLEYFGRYAQLAFKGPAQTDRFTAAMLEEYSAELYNERQEEVSRAMIAMVIPYLSATLLWWLAGMLVNEHFGIMFGENSVLDISLWVALGLAVAATVLIIGLLTQTIGRYRGEVRRLAIEAPTAVPVG